MQNVLQPLHVSVPSSMSGARIAADWFTERHRYDSEVTKQNDWNSIYRDVMDRLEVDQDACVGIVIDGVLQDVLVIEPLFVD